VWGVGCGVWGVGWGVRGIRQPHGRLVQASDKRAYAPPAALPPALCMRARKKHQAPH